GERAFDARGLADREFVEGAVAQDAQVVDVWVHAVVSGPGDGLTCVARLAWPAAVYGACAFRPGRARADTAPVPRSGIIHAPPAYRHRAWSAGAARRCPPPVRTARRGRACRVPPGPHRRSRGTAAPAAPHRRTPPAAPRLR